MTAYVLTTGVITAAWAGLLFAQLAYGIREDTNMALTMFIIAAGIAIWAGTLLS